MKLCPCGSQKRYLDCCGGIILGKFPAKTPEALMRSRYTAHVEKKWEYIKKSMKPPASLQYDIKIAKKKAEAESVEWLGLEVIRASIGSEDPNHSNNPDHLNNPNNPNQGGFVEFKARYRKGGVEHLIHEKSEFQLIDGRWYYMSGVQTQT